MEGRPYFTWLRYALFQLSGDSAIQEAGAAQGLAALLACGGYDETPNSSKHPHPEATLKRFNPEFCSAGQVPHLNLSTLTKLGTLDRPHSQELKVPNTRTLVRDREASLTPHDAYQAYRTEG